MKPQIYPERSEAQRWGVTAELRAVMLLRLKGYHILARRFKSPVGEIDIIARRGRLIAAVEVKARLEKSRALEAVSPRQQRRIASALLYFQAQHPKLAGHDYRFDVIWVARRKWPEHILDAWRI